VKYAGDLAGVALVKSVEVGLDHAFDDFDIVSAGHGGQVLPYESFGDQGFEIRKAAASGMSALGKTARMDGYRGPRGKGKRIKLSDRRRKSIARRCGNRPKKVSGAGFSHRLPSLDGLRSLGAAAAAGNEVVSMARKHRSCC
jgi:hypothetical protein